METLLRMNVPKPVEIPLGVGGGALHETILSLTLVAITMGLSLAHALEFPGKLRLDEATYRRYRRSTPGFTLGGLVRLGNLTRHQGLPRHAEPDLDCDRHISLSE